MDSGVLLKAAVAVAFISVCSVFIVYPDRARRILYDAQVLLIQAAFVTCSLVLVGYLAWSWFDSARGARKQAKRIQEMERISDEVRRKRQQLQADATLAAKKAKEEEESRKRRERGEAAKKSREARAVSALQHQPGAGSVHASEEALAEARERMQEIASTEQERYRERKERERQEAIERAKELRAVSAQQHQPGGGMVQASEEALLLARAKQQERALEAQRRKQEREREEARRTAEALKEEARAGSAARQPGGGAVHTVDSSSSSSSSSGSGRSGGVRSRASPPVWDGPIFPGDELRGWVSPASEEAARIRAQQDAELDRSLQRDRAKEEARSAKEREKKEKEEQRRKREEEKEERRAVLLSMLPPEPPAGTPGRVSIAVRLPDSTVQKRTWLPNNKLEDLYNWVESMESMTMKIFQLARPFPREILAREPSGQLSLDESKLSPQALIVVELLDD